MKPNSSLAAGAVFQQPARPKEPPNPESGRGSLPYRDCVASMLPPRRCLHGQDPKAKLGIPAPAGIAEREDLRRPRQPDDALLVQEGLGTLPLLRLGAVIQGRPEDAGSVSRVAAPDLEAVVVKAIRDHVPIAGTADTAENPTPTEQELDRTARRSDRGHEGRR
jgi:hypothetical protein